MAYSVAIATTDRNGAPGGSLRIVSAVFTGNSSYATGGDALTAADFGLSRLDFIVLGGNATGTRWYAWNAATGKLMSFVSSTGAQTANAADVSADKVAILAYGV